MSQNPLLIEIPTNFETERLLLRAPRLHGDGATVNKAIRASYHELKKWLPFAQTLPEIEETEINLREAHINFLKRESLRFLIFHKETQNFIGSTGFHNIDWDIPKCEIGYWLDTRHSGKGYMTEAIKELTRFAMNQLKCKRVEIRCESENLKSRSIPEKLGYTLEGILRNDDLSADKKKLTDTCIYAITDSDMRD
ncbi:GNAT family N-acetyltransferase [Peribacillus deserti]|uniref:GNAT family N-acetyltransferase n=1 Tax=Peribacillus deserti TaxID=673318 RepID=A0A2N5M177_9BACI|nr:GNAT family N-acetyltransferase [Peribacillus deserti]PLT28126.1 GNAT family N-acetyltransferase [Peribacillus deserti]